MTGYDFIIVGGIAVVVARTFFLSGLLLNYFRSVPPRPLPLEEINSVSYNRLSSRRRQFSELEIP